MNTDVRSVRVAPELRQSGRLLSGLIPYDSRSADLGGFVEVLKPGCFAQTIRDDTVKALWDHETSQPLGNSRAGTLRFQDGLDGLRFECDLDPEISWHRDAANSIRRGDVQGVSFRFQVTERGGDRWGPDPERKTRELREVLKARLMEVSPVSFPAYEESSASVRSRRRGNSTMFGNVYQDPSADAKWQAGELGRKALMLEAEGKSAEAVADVRSKYDRAARTLGWATFAEVGSKGVHDFMNQSINTPPNVEPSAPWEDRGEAAPRTAADYDYANRYPRVEFGRQPLGPFRSLGEQLQAVAKSYLTHEVDPRLQQVRAIQGLSTVVPSDGGFLLQDTYAEQIYKLAFERSELAKLCRPHKVGPNSKNAIIRKIDESSRATGSRWGGVRVYWASEGTTVTASKPKFSRVEMSLEKLMGLCYATSEELEDATQLEQLVTQAFSEEIAWVVDNAILRGTGGGQILGVLNSGALITVDKETGQAAATIIYENVENMWLRCAARSRRNAVWFINQDCESQLGRMALPIGTGGVPVYMPANGLAGDSLARLHNRPVVPIEQCSTLGTVGDILLLDLDQFALADKAGVQTAWSAHVEYLSDQHVFRITYRCNGQPILSEPITPANGSNTLSPFVALATRA